jgi:TorA maturation chaperone TorD
MADMDSELGLTSWAAHVEVRRLLSALLCQPERDALIQESVVPRLVTSLKKLVSGDADGIAGLLTTLDEEDQETLLAEYTRIFIGPDRLPAPPYASVHLEAGRQVLGEVTEGVRRLYAGEGLAVSEGVHEPADHVALEFEFAAFLLEKASQAWGGGSPEEAERLVAKARDFEVKYLRSWLPDLAASIEAVAQTAFYRGVAGSLVVYCNTEMPTLPARSAAAKIEGAESWRSRGTTD